MSNFRISEFKCRCCGRAAVDPVLLEVLEQVRAHFNSPVIINSGFRCRDYNELIGGAKQSQHLLGTAADIIVKGVTPNMVADFLDVLDVGGLGRYDTFTHVDVRDGKARWDNRSNT